VVLSLSVVLLLGVAVVVLCRYASLRIGHAIVCVLFGFYLAASPLAPTIDQAVSAIAGLISGR
jgi:CBS domain containing-hemolysin-like protein